MYDNFDSDYKTLLDKSDKCTMEVNHLRTLGLEVFKILSNLTLLSWKKYYKNIMARTKWLTHRPNNIQVNVDKTAKYGD